MLPLLPPPAHLPFFPLLIFCLFLSNPHTIHRNSLSLLRLSPPPSHFCQNHVWRIENDMLTGVDDGVGWRSDVQGVSLSRWQRIISAFPPSIQFFTLTPFSSYSYILSFSFKMVMLENHLNLATHPMLYPHTFLILFLLHLILSAEHHTFIRINSSPPSPSLPYPVSIPTPSLPSLHLERFSPAPLPAITPPGWLQIL